MLVPTTFVRSLRKRALGLAALVGLPAAVASAGAVTACAETDTVDPLIVRSAIAVRAASITEGLGCGTGGSQVFRYAAVVFVQGTTTAVGSGVFDCFADATFVEVPPLNGTFEIELYLYTESAYTPAAGIVDRALASGDVLALRTSSPTWSTRCTATQLENVQTFAACGPVEAGLAGITGEASNGGGGGRDASADGAPDSAP